MNTCSTSQSEGRRNRAWFRIAATALACAFAATAARADSLWKDDAKPMVADKRAAAKGDIITILVQENNTASKDNNTKTSKQSGLDASISSFLYPPTTGGGLLTHNGQLPAMKTSSKNDFTGGGTINNSEQIIARIAVRVIDVLPNKNLVVEGTRETAFGGEKQTMVLHGVVRNEDVLANNTVFSYNVAEANIKIVTKGTISDSQKKGWFSRVWDKLTPF